MSIRFGHKGRPEVEGTMSQSPDGIYLVDTVDDVARPQAGVKEGVLFPLPKGLATIALVRDKLPHLPLDANAERMFPKEAGQLVKAAGFEL